MNNKGDGQEDNPGRAPWTEKDLDDLEIALQRGLPLDEIADLSSAVEDVLSMITELGLLSRLP